MSEIKYQTDGADRAYRKLFKENKSRYLLADEVGLGKTITAAKVIAKLWADRQEEQPAEGSQKTDIKIGYICGNQALGNQNVRKLKRTILECIPENSRCGKNIIHEKRSERLSLVFLDLITSDSKNNDGKIHIYTVTPSTTIKVESDGTLDERAVAYRLIMGDNEDEILKNVCWGRAKADNKDNKTYKTYKTNESKFILDSILYDEKENKKIRKINERLNNPRIYQKTRKKLEEEKEPLDKKRKDIKCEFDKAKIDFNAMLDEEWKKHTDTVFDECIERSLNAFIFKNNEAMESDTNFKKRYLIDFLKRIKSNESYGKWTKYILNQLIDKCKNAITDYDESAKIPVGGNDEQIMQGIISVIEDTCGKEYIRAARKCMVSLSLNRLNMDLYIADEIQNYSELLYKVNESEKKFRNKSEMDSLLNMILGDDSSSKVLMMSATPFRYRTKLNALENAEKDADADAFLDENGQEDELSSSQNYLKKDSDIYQEFKNVVTYLKNDFDFKSWENLNCEKEKAIKKPDIKGYKDSIAEQSKMLRNANISRVERYMSGTAPAFETKNAVIAADDLLYKELRRIPRTRITEIDSEDVEYGDELVFYDNDFYVFHDGRFYYTNDYDMYDYAEDDEDLLKKLQNELENEKVRFDYIKSTPALFSFINGYKELENSIDKDGSNTLSSQRIKNWQPLFAQPGDTDQALIYNARIYSLVHQLFDEENLHKLLFIPPCHISGGRKLQGVYENSYGVSKRLFFTDYNMTPKSLSVLLTYEANRRVIEDLKEKNKNNHINAIYYTPASDSKLIDFKNLVKYGFNINQNEIVESLCEYDEKYSGENLYGSPYQYAIKKGYNAKIFSKAYFRYMTKLDSIRVLAAYTNENNLYDAIMEYGENCCIRDIFDEYAEYIGSDEEFGAAFGEVVKINFSSVKAFTDNNGTAGSLTMRTDFATGNYSDKTQGNPAKAFTEKITRFNSPLRPFNFISTSIGNEGFDFHVYCRKIVHWSLEYNPVKFEQREGRINRYQCYANRLQVNKILESNNADFENWSTAFKQLKDQNEQLHKDSKGLFPDFVVPVQDKDLGFVRECYYYPFSSESSSMKNVLQAVGYYRGLLGQSGDDTFEEELKNFIKDKGSKSEFFINLYPHS